MTGRGAQSLNGQHAVITGGGRGIGAAIAAELARLGANLTLMGRNAETLDARAIELRSSAPVDVAAVAVDVTEPAAVERAFGAAVEQLGPVAILVNNAGSAFSAPFGRTHLDRWREMLDINLIGPVLCSAQVLPSMIAADEGRIVNIASTAGLRGYRYVTAYAAAKHGLVGLTRSLALELSTTGITVNAVCPGFTDTDLIARAVATIVARTGRSAEEARVELAGYNPQGRLIDPSEVAQAVGWLCLPESRAITGQAIVVAGGEVM
jgi:NAD(P)-dependent dehydrogenase (short-subunit alcohol dehydrogenase family)